jgi:hypothetical protein
MQPSIPAIEKASPGSPTAARKPRTATRSLMQFFNELAPLDRVARTRVSFYHVGLGKDHTIFVLVEGKVAYRT